MFTFVVPARLSTTQACGQRRCGRRTWTALRAPRHPSAQTTNACKPRKSCPSARICSLSHDKKCLGWSGPVRPTKWLNPPGRVWSTNVLAADGPPSCLRRPCGIKSAPDALARLEPRAQQPRQWRLTPLPPCYSVSSHSRLGNGRVYRRLDASRSFPASASARDHFWNGRRNQGRPRCRSGFNWGLVLRGMPPIDRIKRHLPPIPPNSCALAANDCWHRTSISTGWVRGCQANIGPPAPRYHPA